MISPEPLYDEICIKEETIIEEYLDDIKDEWSIDSQQIIFDRDTTKCGEVMIGYHGQFTFVCILCMEHFPGLDEFGCHIRDFHLSSYDFTEIPNKIVSKQDPLDEKKSTASVKSATSMELHPVLPIGTQKQSLEVDQEIEDQNDAESSESINNDDVVNEISSSAEITHATRFANGRRRSAEENEYFCVFCGRSYQTKNSYRAHMKNKHPDGIEVVEPKKDIVVRAPNQMICKYCDKKFNDSMEFKAHVGSHTGRKRFVCPFCPKVFASRHNRQSHINVHTGERPYKCSHCPKAFSDATNLAMHERVHLRIMNFACDYCDKRFVQSQEKKVHERTHTGEKPFQCEECGRRFISHVKLTEHSRRHKNIKNYICKVCDKAFYSSSLLKDHSIMHTAERPFHCNVCGQSFPRRKSLRAHQQLHSNEKKYVCDTCGKAFAQCAGLYSHRKSHGK